MFCIPEQLQRVPGAHLLGPEVGPLPGDLPVDLDPARVDLDPDRLPGRVREGGAEERPPHPGEGVEDAAPGLREELDQRLHEPRRLVGPVALADLVAQLPRVGGPQDRAREEEPVLAVELVEGVAGVLPPRARRRADQVVLRRRLRGRLLRRLPGGSLPAPAGHFFSHFRQAAASVLRSS